MLLYRRLKFFLRDESGVVTTDFLVLTAIVVGISSISMNAISSKTQQASSMAASGIEFVGNGLP